MTDWIHTILFAGALAALTYGFYLAWAPLGWIVPGVIVLSFVVRARSVGNEK